MTTKNKPTPTLAELRKLAKKKGYVMAVSWYEYSFDSPDNDVPDIAFCYGAGACVKATRSAAFAALNTLPDKKGAGR